MKLIPTAELVEKLEFTPKNLAAAVQEQAKLFYHASLWANKSQTEYDDLSARLDIKSAEQMQSFRLASESSAKKPTETALKEMVSLVPAVKALAAQVLEAQQKMQRHKALAEAYRHRKSALDAAVSLRMAEGKAYA